MTWQITFKSTVRFVGNRPYADVKLNPRMSSSPTYKCLVDTGADYLQLPISAAGLASLQIASASQFIVTTAAGSQTMHMLKNVFVEIEGVGAHVDVLFDPTNNAPPLAGRSLLLTAFDLGFQVGDWHWN